MYFHQEIDGKQMPYEPPKRLDVYTVPPGIRPIVQKTGLELVIWGVRNMESYKLLSVDRPSVVVEVRWIYLYEFLVLKHLCNSDW